MASHIYTGAENLFYSFLFLLCTELFLISCVSQAYFYLFLSAAWFYTRPGILQTVVLFLKFLSKRYAVWEPTLERSAHAAFGLWAAGINVIDYLQCWEQTALDQTSGGVLLFQRIKGILNSFLFKLSLEPNGLEIYVHLESKKNFLFSPVQTQIL